MEINNLQQAVKQLAALPPLEYESVRKVESKKLNLRASALDEAVAWERAKHNKPEESSEGLGVAEAEPWPSPVDGLELYQELVQTFNKYLMLQPHQADALALWSIFSYCIDANNIAPKLLIFSPEKRCGKSTLLDVMLGIVWKPLAASSITPAVLYRVIESIGGTIVVDEADTFLNGNSELNGIINSGHRKSMAFSWRCQGDAHEVKKFSTWAPTVIAMIGKPADTIIDRSVLVHMKRKKDGEEVERFVFDKAAPELAMLASKIARWKQDNFDSLCGAEPILPEGLNDRACDNWRPLIAIAEQLGGDCPEKARHAATGLASVDDDEDNTSIGVLLLSDIRDIFSASKDKKIQTVSLLHELSRLEERPWAEFHRGQEISPRDLAKTLKPFDIRPKKMRFSNNTAMGYEKSQFSDAFERYLSGTPEQCNDNNGLGVTLSGTDTEHVPYCEESNLLNMNDCSVVPPERQELPF